MQGRRSAPVLLFLSLKFPAKVDHQMRSRTINVLLLSGDGRFAIYLDSAAAYVVNQGVVFQGREN